MTPSEPEELTQDDAWPIPADPWGVFVDRAIDRGAGTGPLSGLAYAAKDLFVSPHRAPGLGLHRGRPTPDKVEAAVLHTLRNAGARFTGFAAMTALAYEPSGVNSKPVQPLNPWDTTRITGASSSGSAVAIAADLSDFSIGSDTGGSLRIPAHCCGVSAWKPSFGLIPTAGAMPLAPSFDTVGFMARSIETLARISSMFFSEGAGVSERIGIAMAPITESAPAIRDACLKAASVIHTSGVELKTLGLGDLIAGIDRDYFTVLEFEAAASHEAALRTETLPADLAKRLSKGLDIPKAVAEAARQRLVAAQHAWLDTVFNDVDAILLPVMPEVTPTVAACMPDNPRFSGRTLYRLSAYTRFVNALGLPAVAFPVGFDENGMPIGAQLIGRPGEDGPLLKLAQQYQSETNWHLRRADAPLEPVTTGHVPA